MVGKIIAEAGYFKIVYQIHLALLNVRNNSKIYKK